MRYRSIFLAVLCGVLLILIFPTVIFGCYLPNLGILAWIALIPLFLAIRDKSPGNAFGLGLLAGLISFSGILYWIGILSPLIGLLILVFYLALYIAFFCFLFTLLSRRSKSVTRYLISAAGLWVSLEYLRSSLLTGFPWTLLGHSQYRNISLIQMSEFTGVYGVSFLIVLVNAVIASVISRVRLSASKAGGSTRGVRRIIVPVIIVAIIVGACFTWGRLKLGNSFPPSCTSTLRVGIVQGNVDLEEKWSSILHEKVLDKHVRLTEEVARKEPDLIVWSETATASCLKHEGGDLIKLSDLANKLKSHLLIGSLDLADRGDYYNSAFLISPQGNIAYQYNKVHLVPFGEFVPFKKEIPSLAKFVEGLGGGGFKAGEELTLFDIDGKRFGVLICYEAAFDNLVRNFVKKDADFIVNITNDAWYKKTSAPYQHFSFAIFRAIENRVPLVRAANTGISGFIDPYGRIKKDLDIFLEGTLFDKISLKKQKTFYTTYGNLFAYLCLGLSGLFLIGALIKRS
ncbi:apolipoprotein N-acyltransferase [bacterium]|nr:apolipoprotein N-acyltransferase [bacterium]